jgi:uncharacterized protein involved in oxidation of intracellular sulfur
MKLLLILNDAPYGTERTYNALRLADVMLTMEEDLQLSVFLVGDAVLCAKRGQQTPQGFYNVERMLHPVLRRGMVLVCTTCMDARGMRDEELVEGCRRAKLGELGNLTLDADKVLTF